MGYMKGLSIGNHTPKVSGGMFQIRASTYFDLSAIPDAVERAKRRNLMEAAKDIWTTARRSMKTRKGPSMAGMPPHRHRSKRPGASSGLQKSLRYAYDEMNDSALIGPSSVYGPGIADIAQRHEFGGTYPTRNTRRRTRKVGDAGEMLIASSRGGRDASGHYHPAAFRNWATAKKIKDSRGKTRIVVYAPIRTEAQARRANEIQEELFGASQYPATYPKREFMDPALQAERAGIPRHWADSVK